MPFNPSPQYWFPGCDIITAVTGGVSRQGLFIPLTSLPQLQVNEALSTSPTHDVRKVYFAICEALHSAFQSKAPADRPSQMSTSKGYSPTVYAGGYTPSSNPPGRSFSFNFGIEIKDVEVAPEPV